MGSKAETATKIMETRANDNKYGYDQKFRWGEKGDYDCSSGIISAWEEAGVNVKECGATYTGNMKKSFIKAGFEDVTKKVDFVHGKGFKRGDVLLHEGHHTAMYCGNGKEVEFSINERGGTTGGAPGDQTGKECLIRDYHNHPWNCCLRWVPRTRTLGNKDKILYAGRMKKNGFCYINSEGIISDKFPMLRAGSLVDVTDYKEVTEDGITYVLVRIPFPSVGFVHEFVLDGSIDKVGE